jgi:hypothetical protein
MGVGVSTARGHKMARDLIIGDIDKEIDNNILHKSSPEISNVRSVRKRISNGPVPTAGNFQYRAGYRGKAEGIHQARRKGDMNEARLFKN